MVTSSGGRMGRGSSLVGFTALGGLEATAGGASVFPRRSSKPRPTDVEIARTAMITADERFRTGLDLGPPGFSLREGALGGGGNRLVCVAARIGSPSGRTRVAG